MFEVWRKAFIASFELLTSLPLLLYWLVSVGLVVALIWYRRDAAAMKEYGKKTLLTIAAAVIAWLLLFIWQWGYQQKTAEIAAVPAYVEPQDSLRKRTVRLANDLDAFLAERGARRPIGQSDDAKQYDKATINLYVAEHKSRTMGILQELRAKGLDVGLLDAPGAAQQRFLLPDETQRLRDLAFHLDEHGGVIKF